MTLNDTPQHGELLQQNLHSTFELYEEIVTQMLSHVDAQSLSLDFSGVGALELRDFLRMLAKAKALEMSR